MEVATLALAGSATALATGLGAVPVFLLGPRAEQLRPFLWGTAVGLMGVAAVVGLLLPALEEGGEGSVVGGFFAGVAFLLASRRLLRGRDVHVGELHGAGVDAAARAPRSTSGTAARLEFSGRRRGPPRWAARRPAAG